MKETPSVPKEIEFPPLIEVYKTDRKYDVPFGNIEDTVETYKKETKRLNLFFVYQVLALFCIAVISIYTYNTNIIYMPLLATLFIVLAFFEGVK